MGELSPAELAAAGAPVLYTPEQAADIMGDGSGALTANWFREKARKELIPCTRVGRVIMFSPEDLAEIARAGQRRPQPRPALVPRTPARRKAAEGGGAPVLQVRTPRRKRSAA
jgi:hypothetical protein